MKFFQEGEWSVTTPIYIGSEVDVKRAQACVHEEYAAMLRHVKDRTMLVQERCKACVATRAKFRPATKEELKESGNV